MFPNHQIYAEPFFGAGHLLFWKHKSKHEWINDKNDLLINLWRVLKDKAQLSELVNYLHLHPKSRSLFFQYRDILKDPEKYSKIPLVKRAAMSYYIIKCCFGTNDCFTGRESWGFSPEATKLKSFYTTNWESVLWRLRDVIIENRDFRIFINLFAKWANRRDDKSDTVFMYCDPPYYLPDKEKEADLRYVDNLVPQDHHDLAQILLKLPFNFMLTIDDCDEVRQLYSDEKFHIHEIQTKYTANMLNLRDITELVITNYDIPNCQGRLFLEKE